ncbi:MAG: RNA 3'-terminal phosphate cyclase [Gemmatimonadota bacterium]
MIEIDGSAQLGSGTIVRFSVVLAALLGVPLRIVRARAGRDKPGLRPQHMAAIAACAEMTDAEVEGLAVGSSSFIFRPMRRPRGGRYRWDIGTAGSTTMFGLCVLPLAARADARVEATIVGGLFQDFAPSAHHLAHVLAPLLGRMGIGAELRVLRPGYVPRGSGEIEIVVRPAAALAPLALEERGQVETVRGIALSSHLEEARVSDRMAETCEARLRDAGLSTAIERVYDTTSAQRGADLVAWAETSTGCRIGADHAGAPGRRSEAIGRRVAEDLLADLATGATVDRHAADMLVLFAAIAAGESRWTVPRPTDHLVTNLWLVERFGVSAQLEGQQVRVRGLGC